MTYREAIKKTMNKVRITDYDQNGNEVGFHEEETFAFQGIVQGLALLHVHYACIMLGETFPNINIGGVTGEGSPVEPTISNVKDLLAESNFDLRTICFENNMRSFMGWFLDQPIPEENEENKTGDIWWATSHIIDKWNEYSNLQQTEGK